MKQIHSGNLTMQFWWFIPFLIGVSKNNIDNKAVVYAIHITPFLEIGINWRYNIKK